MDVPIQRAADFGPDPSHQNRQNMGLLHCQENHHNRYDLDNLNGISALDLVIWHRTLRLTELNSLNSQYILPWTD